MRIKVSKTNLGGAVAFALLTVVFNFLLSVLFYTLIWYWFFPNLHMLIPSLQAQFEVADDMMISSYYNFTYRVCATFSMLPATIFAYRLLKKRKGEFCQYSKCKMNYTEGVVYYLQEYAAADVIVFAGMSLFLCIVYVAAGEVPLVRAFPLAFVLFDDMGVIWGFLLLLALFCFSACGGVFFAQKRWRAEYYIGE